MGHTERIAGLDVVLAGGADGAGGGTGPVVVLMHCFGSPGDELAPLSRALALPGDVRFVFRAAWMHLPSSADGRAWWLFDPQHLGRFRRGEQSPQRTRQVPVGLVDARTQVIALLDELSARLAIPEGKLVLGGFSQGAMLACDVAAHVERPLAGLVLLSGTLCAEEQWARGLARRRGLRALQSHGLRDAILDVATAERLRDLLRAAGLDVEWIPFAGGHEIPHHVVDRLGRFLRTVLD